MYFIPTYDSRIAYVLDCKDIIVSRQQSNRRCTSVYFIPTYDSRIAYVLDWLWAILVNVIHMLLTSMLIVILVC